MQPSREIVWLNPRLGSRQFYKDVCLLNREYEDFSRKGADRTIDCMCEYA